MAQIIDISQTALVPTDADDAILSNDWGIDGAFTSLTGLIIQSETYTDEPQIDQTFDQKNRLVHELTYDHKETCSLDVIGLGGDTAAIEALTPNKTVSYKRSGESTAETWLVRSCQYQGAYNDKKKWSVTLEKWAKFPGTGS